MKKYGLVVAVENKELEEYYGKEDQSFLIGKFPVKKYIRESYQLYVVETGAGQIAAAGGTQILISNFGVEAIFNFGVVGGLTEEISKERLSLVKDLIHYDFDTSEVDGKEKGRYLKYPETKIKTDEKLLKIAKSIIPDIKEVTCLSGDKFIAKEEKKRELAKTFSGHIIEMEAAGIVMTADMNNIPSLLIKVVADSLKGGAEEFRREKRKSALMGIQALDKVMAEISKS